MADQDAQVEMMAAMLPHVPPDVLRRGLDVLGTADLACAWFLENDWHELQAPAAAAPQPPGGGGDDDDDDDDDEAAGAPPAALTHAPPAPPPAPAAKRQRKTVAASADAPAAGGDPAFWCAFDDNVAAKTQLQLMNLRPRGLGHSRVTLWARTTAEAGAGEAEKALPDVFAALPPASGYWLVPLKAGDLDDAWWQLLRPHLDEKRLGATVQLRTVAPRAPPRLHGPAATAPPPAPPCFDDLDKPAAPRGPGLLTGRAPPATDAAVLVAPCSSDEAELARVGEYLASLFPAKCPLHFRTLEAGAKGRYADDPRDARDAFDAACHEKKATHRVKKVVEKREGAAAGLFEVAAPKKVRYALEKRASEEDPLASWVEVGKK